MTAEKQLSDFTARVPFLPFFVKLIDGETIVVRKRFKAVASIREFAVTTDGKQMRHIPYKHIADFGLVPPDQLEEGGGPKCLRS